VLLIFSTSLSKKEVCQTITICLIKTFFHRFFLAREKKRWKNVFLFLSDMKFCFMKRLSLPNRLFFHVEITFFHALASSVKKSDSSVKKSSSSMKKSTFFHGREKVMKGRIWMFRGGWELI
jgi:hypothetical protein